MKRYKKIFVRFFVLIIIAIFLKRSHHKYKSNLPITKILWWTSESYDLIKECGIYKCNFTSDRSILNEAKAILFYGSKIRPYDLPLPRLSHHIWGLYHEEAPKNQPFLIHEKVLKYFNYTSTFSRNSDVPVIISDINYKQLITRKYLIPINKKNKLRKKLAPVIFLQSVCNTLSGRDQYISKLMKYIEIDSYGNCLNNKDLPESLSDPKNYLDTIESDEIYRFLAQYKFVIGYENGICNDYITEKLWRPLIIGSIPIYFGSPTIRDWLPNNKSAILITDFNSPKELADFIKYLDENDTEYNKYLDHKYSENSPISNNFLKNILTNGFLESNRGFENFECFICEKLHNPIYNNQYVHATGNHYNCSDVMVYSKTFGFDIIRQGIWYIIDDIGKCEAESLDRFLANNINFTVEDYQNDLINNAIKKICDMESFSMLQLYD